ncbi:MAG: hypothetical protein ACOX2E_03280 [Syntrophaceticus sp.]|jgi:hypothetical protein
MKLEDWLSQNPGPYQLVLHSYHPEMQSENYTAGKVVAEVNDVFFENGVASFVDKDKKTEIALVAASLIEERVCPETGGWAAAYFNFKVNVDGFYPYVIATLQKI